MKKGIKTMIIKLMGTILKEFEDETKKMLSSMDMLNLTDQDYSYFRYLMVLKNHPNINQNDLAHFVNVNKASVSKAVKYLSNHELIMRVQDERDNRVRKLSLTDLGDDLCDKFKKVLHDVEKDLLQGFSNQDICAFNDMLRKAYENIVTDENKLLLNILD